MAVIYNQAVKNERLLVSRDAIDAAGAATLQIGTLNMVLVLANVALALPSFSDASGGSMALAGVPRSDNDTVAGGKAESARIIDADGNVIVSGLTVGLAGSGANIILNVVDLQAHQRVDINSGVIYHG